MIHVDLDVDVVGVGDIDGDGDMNLAGAVEPDLIFWSVLDGYMRDGSVHLHDAVAVAVAVNVHAYVADQDDADVMIRGPVLMSRARRRARR